MPHKSQPAEREEERSIVGMNLWLSFERFDVDGSGDLTADEVVAILTRQSGGQPMTLKDAEEFVAQFDANHDGKLSYAEFCTAMGQPSPPEGSIAHKIERVRLALGLEAGPLPQVADAAMEALGVADGDRPMSLVEKVMHCHDTLFEAHVAQKAAPTKAPVARAQAAAAQAPHMPLEFTTFHSFGSDYKNGSGGTELFSPAAVCVLPDWSVFVADAPARDSSAPHQLHVCSPDGLTWSSMKRCPGMDKDWDFSSVALWGDEVSRYSEDRSLHCRMLWWPFLALPDAVAAAPCTPGHHLA